ncbi:MAG TPA: glycosyltransferase family 39 protein [Planctomycetota bacterium]|nr:glycosyltransferase family 39 protein [Planctomycetota bacterium]
MESALASAATATDARRAAIAARCSWLLLGAAAVILLTASLRNIGDPWENGQRGGVAARYSDVAVAHTLAYGLGVTRGMPTFVVELDDGTYQRNVNFHHPPYYWLYLSLWGYLFGNTPTVLRVGQLVVFLPGLLALFWLVRGRAGPVAAGLTALLFASAPLVGYYGPMALQDGAVLGCGLVTLWCFQRHLDAPSRGRWLATAAMFFVTASWDYSGYWWGPAMFVLALDQTARWRAVAWVMSFVPVSMLAFAVLAVHYGFEFGGPLGFVRELLHLMHMEGEMAKGKVDEGAVDLGRFLHAMRVLFIDYANQFLLGLAVLGSAAAAWVRGAGLRRLAVCALAMLTPGLLNYGAMIRHAVDHEFWFLHGFAGLAGLAALAPVAGLGLIGRGGVLWRGAGIVLLLAAGTTVAWGTVRTHQVITHWQYVETNDTIAVVNQALPHLVGCQTTLTSAPPTTQVQFGLTSLGAYGVDTAEKVRMWFDLAQQIKAKGRIGFVVHPKHRNSPMTELLDTMAERLEAGDVWVYRVRLAQ